MPGASQGNTPQILASRRAKPSQDQEPVRTRGDPANLDTQAFIRLDGDREAHAKEPRADHRKTDEAQPFLPDVQDLDGSIGVALHDSPGNRVGRRVGRHPVRVTLVRGH